ncbi:MAG: YccF domain-containing protein [Leptolyngbya sp. DLM2.Bin27]|nr:MAG: YccF domain-containing protein [Leptolyngbya sp. DLM2.Bin27]
MSLLGNIIWLIFGGFLTGLGYIVGGLLLCLTIIGIPFGVQAIKLGAATMTPFGRKLVDGGDPNSTLTIVLNVVWLFLFGWEIALAHLFHAVLLAITIIGLPFAKQHIKLLPMALLPFGKSFERL